MKRQKLSKLNNLMSSFPKEGVVTSVWLESHGYYRQLVKQYCDVGWLKRLGKGAYGRLNDSVHWEGAVNVLQNQLQLKLHVGGLTALGLYGVMHYVPFQSKSVSLYSSVPETVFLPRWFSQCFENVQFFQKRLFDTPLGLSKRMVNGVELVVSEPERALLEVCALVPNKITLQHLSELMEALNRLRPQKIQALLEACRSVKVKRLFLCLSDMYNLNFFGDIDLSKVNLGSGKRSIAGGGVYDSKWKISFPKSMQNDFNIGTEGA